MSVFAQLKNEIRRAERIGVSLPALTRECKLGRTTLYRWLDGTVQHPRVSTMLAVARALGKRMELSDDVRKMVRYYRWSYVNE